MYFPNFELTDGADATNPAIDHQPTAEFAQVDRVATATTPISIEFDANRLALLKRAKFQGPAYREFTDELWLYARVVLLSKLRSGLVFAWCAEGGVAVSPIRRSVCVQRRAEGGNRLNLHQLVVVAQDRDPEQGAECIVIATVSLHHVPGGE